MRAGLPVAPPGSRIGILGGSFDPAHAGHVHITEAALNRFDLDRVWWLVSPGNPLKAQGPQPLEQRMAAARGMIRHPRVEVTGIEAQLGSRMTADTIAALQRLYPTVRFVWLMGADNLVQFDRWDRWREIAAHVPIGVIARPGWRMSARFSRAARILWRDRVPDARIRDLADYPPPAWAMINVPLNKLSSTQIRAGRQERS